MASEVEEFEKNIENLRNKVKETFMRVYTSLKARELKTLRQLDAIHKQYQDDKDFLRNCVQNIRLSFDNESILISNISKYGEISFENHNFDSNTFILEDYDNPEGDHMYSYKNIKELCLEEEMEAIQEAALKQVTTAENCICHVNIKSEEVSKQFTGIQTNISPIKVSNTCPINLDSKLAECTTSRETTDDEKSDISLGDIKKVESADDEKSDCSNGDMKKIDPTDDWLNTIKNQTETEPSQVSDVMEHSTITCL